MSKQKEQAAAPEQEQRFENEAFDAALHELQCLEAGLNLDKASEQTKFFLYEIRKRLKQATNRTYQDAINQILSNPETMKQVQSLGEQLGLSKPAPKPEPKNEMLGAMQSLAPLMGSFSADDDVSRLFQALKPFLGEEKQRKLEQAQRLMKLIKVIPLIKDSGLLF